MIETTASGATPPKALICWPIQAGSPKMPTKATTAAMPGITAIKPKNATPAEINARLARSAVAPTPFSTHHHCAGVSDSGPAAGVSGIGQACASVIAEQTRALSAGFQVR